ncbi:hypothetical protein ACQP2F_38090 [Actinoplanes sp. CA-030573]|uniref:hypothetical protein n=1 Tax=Actinoplanes sp. CA-030573 TaxID=3239898 RepID=UPI003D8CE29C
MRAGRSGTVLAAGFVVVLFVSEVAVTLPDLDATDQHVADFYAGHRAVVVAMQLLGFVAAGLLAMLALRVRELDRASGYALLGVAGVALLPGLVTAVLALAADPAHPATSGRLNAAAAIADDLLFLSVAGFAATVWSARGAYRPVLRWFAAAVSVVCLLRGVLGVAEREGVLGTVAPFAFLVLVVAVGVSADRRPRSGRAEGVLDGRVGR